MKFLKQIAKILLLLLVLLLFYTVVNHLLAECMYRKSIKTKQYKSFHIIFPPTCGLTALLKAERGERNALHV